MIKSIYLIGSLRNPRVPVIANKLRAAGYDVFDEWHATAPDTDDHWQKYCNARGWTYDQALSGLTAQTIFEFDKKYLDRCDAAVMLLPAGRSGHLELGYKRGCGKPGFILLDGAKVDRYDIMYRFATAVVPDLAALCKALKKA